MRRRDFVTLIGGAAAWPTTLRAQPSERMQVVGALLSQGNDARSQASIAQFRGALQELGWSEGRNVRFELRWAGGDIESLHTFAVELFASCNTDLIAVRRRRNGMTALAIIFGRCCVLTSQEVHIRRKAHASTRAF